MHTYLFLAHSLQPVVALKYPVCINIQESVASKNFHENWHKRAQQRPRMLPLTREEVHLPFSMWGWKHEEARGWNTGEMIHNTMWLIADKQYGWKINLFISERFPLSHAPLGLYENDDAWDFSSEAWCDLIPPAKQEENNLVQFGVESAPASCLLGFTRVMYL